MGVIEKQGTRAELEMEFNRLYYKNEKKVFSLAWRLTGDEEAAKDIRQKTFLTLHIKLKKVLAHPSPEGWLFKTVHNFVMDYQREQAYRGKHEADYELAEQMSAPQPVNEVKEFLECLPPWVTKKQKEMLTLYYCYGYTMREIADKLGLTYDALRARMVRLHAKLREYGFGKFE